MACSGATSLAATSKIDSNMVDMPQPIFMLESASRNGLLYQKWARVCLRHMFLSLVVFQ